MDRKEGSSFSPPKETPGGSSYLSENEENNLGKLISDEALDALDEYGKLVFEMGVEGAKSHRKTILAGVPSGEQEELGGYMDLINRLREGRVRPSEQFRQRVSETTFDEVLKKAS